MVRRDRALYFILPLSLLAPAASAQRGANESAVSPTEIIYRGGCPEAPAADAPVSTCIPGSERGPLNASESAGVSEEKPAIAAGAAKVDLIVPEGSALRIALDQRTRVSHPGEAVHGTVVETIYAFDQPVIPAGSVATGRVTKVNAVPKVKRALAYTNGDLSPVHPYEVTFDTVILPDGRRLAIETTVSPGTADVVHLVSRTNANQKSGGGAVGRAKSEVADKIQEGKNQLHKSWEQVSAPGRIQRLKRAMVAQLPYRRQYIEPGTRFNADLGRAIAFGQMERSSTDLSALASAMAPDTTVKARLVAEVSSATATRGNRVDAVLTEPLYSAAHKLILPANSRIVGEVVQSKAAQKFHRNGELRLIFERIEIPEEAQRAADETARQKAAAQGRASQNAGAANSPELLRPELAHRNNVRVTGNLEGVEVDRRDHMTLDEEGGAHTTDSKTRYLSTGAAILLAAAASHPDAEHGTVDNAGDPGVRTAAGGSGFRITGALISLAAKSSGVSMAFGVYGASASVYTNFLSRGREVVFPKDTPLEIGFGSAHSDRNQATP